MRFSGFLAAAVAVLAAFVTLADDVPATLVKPVRIKGGAPEYPPIARRYNLSGEVIARLTIEPDGHVAKAEILHSPADVLSEAVTQTVLRWQYKELPVRTEGTVQIPFQLTGGGDSYAFGTAVRSLAAPAPASTSELGIEPVEGWSRVRMLIDAAGAVSGVLLLKSSSDEFRAVSERIVAALRFNAAAAEISGYKATVVNLFFINVLENGEIRINQLSGV